MPAAVAALAPFAALLAWPLLPPLAAVMLLLVALVGGVTFRFASRYLHGDPGRARFERWFIATLAAAALVVVARDLVVLALAWTATSLSLHQLLSLRDDRPATAIAAHKKFLLSRLADVAVLGAVALLGLTFGTTDREAVLAAVGAREHLGATVELAGALLALGVILRSAQLPFHGWLIQVMEAPTPVSALLHAGLVNLGAYVLIALGPLMGRLVVAQALLVAVGALTAVFASVVLLTRGSVKGALAWSTCAQMGFVLLECGLGAYDLALLHLIGHALYKAHAFLRSGTLRAARPATSAAATDLRTWGLAALVAALVVPWIAARAGGADALARPALQLSALVLTLAVATGLAHAHWHTGLRGVRAALAFAFGLPLLVGVGHRIAAAIVPVVAESLVPGAALVAVGLAFIALAGLQALVTARPQVRFVRALHPHALAGFHLDEVFTRLTFRLWPPAMPARREWARRLVLVDADARAA